MNVILMVVQIIIRVSITFIFVTCLCSSLLFKTEEAKRTYDLGVIMSGLILLLLI